MKFAIENGVLWVEGKTVNLPGVLVQFHRFEESLLVRVDIRSTARNLFKISALGEIEWQVNGEDEDGGNFTEVSIEQGSINVRDLSGNVYCVDSDSGRAAKFCTCRNSERRWRIIRGFKSE